MFIEVTDEFIFHMKHLKCPWLIQIETIDTKTGVQEMKPWLEILIWD